MKHLLFFALVFGYVSAALADIVNEAVRITCSPELAYIEVTLDNINGKTAEKAFEKDPKGLFEKYGLLSLNRLIHNPSTPDVSFTNFTSSCEINGSTYTILIDPYSRASYECGGYVTLYLSIKKDDKLIVDDLLFGSCSDVWTLTKVKFLPLENETGGYIQTFGQLYGRDYHLFEDFDFSSKTPVLIGEEYRPKLEERVKRIKRD